MGIFSRATDYYLTYKFIKALIQPFNKTDAYKLGIIDDEGNILKKKRDLKTTEEKDAYGFFNRMVWNLKKLIQKVPVIGKSLGSLAAATYMFFKEDYDPVKLDELKRTTFLKFVWDDLQETMTAGGVGGNPAPVSGMGYNATAGDDDLKISKKAQKKIKKKKKKKKKVVASFSDYRQGQQL